MKEKDKDNIELEELEDNQLNIPKHRPFEVVRKVFKGGSTIAAGLAAAYIWAEKNGVVDKVKDTIRIS